MPPPSRSTAASAGPSRTTSTPPSSWPCSSAGITASGSSGAWSTCRHAADEDRRQLHRELIALKAQRTEHTNRIKGLLAGLGLGAVIDAEFPERLEGLRQWDGTERAERAAPAHPPRVRALATRGATDPRPGGRADATDPRPGDAPGGASAAAAQAQGDRRERRVAAGAGVLRLAGDPQPPRAGEPGRLDADARTTAGRVGASRGSARRAIGGSGG